MYAIYGNMDPINNHQYTPFMLAYIPAPWILWVSIPEPSRYLIPLIIKYQDKYHICYP